MGEMNTFEEMIMANLDRAEVLPAKTFCKMASIACPKGADTKKPAR
jgi:hypothetical protein